MISDEEKDLYIKSKIKDGNIPPKINDLFENSLKIMSGAASCKAIIHSPLSILHYHLTLSISTPSLRKSSRKCGRRNYLTVYMFY